MKHATSIGIAGAALGGLLTWNLSRRRPRFNPRGKVVLITGGSRGLGLQLAREFGSHGAKIAICARNPAELLRAREDLIGRGIDTVATVCDVSNQREVEQFVEEALRRLASIDVLVNNAGVIRVAPIAQQTVADFEHAMNTMFWGTLHTTLAVLPHMRAKRQGRIVNITSIGGKVSLPHLVPYSCAKFATVALSEGLRVELASSGIRVVTIVPGLMRTGSHLRAEFKGDYKREYRWFAASAATPIVSIGVERAARAIVRACSRGDVERILSVPAAVLARIHGLFPELTIGALGLVNRFLLPQSPDLITPSQTGSHIRDDIDSRLLDILTLPGQHAAEALNELS